VSTPINGLSARLVLCDLAQVSDGNLTLVGTGWSFINPGIVNFGVGVFLELDPGEMPKPHRFELVLRDADGQPVRLDGAAPPQSAPADHPVGMPVKAGLAFNFVGIQLQPSCRYQLAFTVDSTIVVVEDFSTTPVQQQLKVS
jgi:hypothetical protein